LHPNFLVYFLAALAFVSGSSLIFIGAIQYPILNSGEFCYGDLFSCSTSFFSFCWLLFGSVFVFLAYPIAKSNSREGDDHSLWNKKISGKSLVISGVVVSIFGSIALLWFQPIYACSVMYGCPSIFYFNDAWLDIFYGLSLVIVGLTLLILYSGKESKMLPQTEELPSA